MIISKPSFVFFWQGGEAAGSDKSKTMYLTKFGGFVGRARGWAGQPAAGRLAGQQACGPASRRRLAGCWVVDE